MTEHELLENGYKKYRGEKIDVFFNRDMCTHAANCLKGNGEVFNVRRRPWILPDNAEATEVARIVDTCPSGALKYV